MSNIGVGSSIQVLVPEVLSLYEEIAKRLSAFQDPSTLEGWMRKRGVSLFSKTYGMEKDWVDHLDLGANLHSVATKQGKKLFRTATKRNSDESPERISCVIFVASSAVLILQLLRKFRDEDLVVMEVLHQ